MGGGHDRHRPGATGQAQAGDTGGMAKGSGTMRRVCVFAGSSVGARPVYTEAARALGVALAARGIGIVYGGGGVGLMGVLSDAALGDGGEVIGVIPRPLATKELTHARLTELHVVETMHQRKALMADLADGFIALPGGLGTFDELFEMLTWSQLGIHVKPVALLDVGEYYASLRSLVRHAVAEGFIPVWNADVLTASDVDTLIDAMLAYQPPEHPGKIAWITGDQR